MPISYGKMVLPEKLAEMREAVAKIKYERDENGSDAYSRTT
jgi:hypothetical protein